MDQGLWGFWAACNASLLTRIVSWITVVVLPCAPKNPIPLRPDPKPHKILCFCTFRASNYSFPLEFLASWNAKTLARAAILTNQAPTKRWIPGQSIGGGFVKIGAVWSKLFAIQNGLLKSLQRTYLKTKITFTKLSKIHCAVMILLSNQFYRSVM